MDKQEVPVAVIIGMDPHLSRRSHRATWLPKTRRRLVVELIGQLDSIDKKIEAADEELQQLVTDRGCTLMGLHGIGPSSAARLLADVGNIRRFRDRDRFASCKRHSTHRRLLRRTTAPPPLSSRESQNQPCPAHHGRRATPKFHQRPRILRRQEAAGKTSMKAMRALKRRLSNVVYARMVADQRRREEAGPGRALGDDSAIQRDRPNPQHRPFGQATSQTCHQPG